MSIDTLILKAVLLLRRCGNTYQTKDEQIAEQREWIDKGYTNRDSIEEWIDSLKDELAKTQEQKEAEAEEFRRHLIEAETAQAMREIEFSRNDRDEWDDLWDDRARSCGATRF